MPLAVAGTPSPSVRPGTLQTTAPPLAGVVTYKMKVWQGGKALARLTSGCVGLGLPQPTERGEGETPTGL